MYHVQSLLPWLLFAGLFLLNENRNKQAALVLIPFGVTWLMYVLAKAAMRLPSSVHVELDMMFTVIIGSVAAFLLLSERFAGRYRLVLFFVPAAVFAVAFAGGHITRDTIDMCIILAPSVLSLMGAMLIARIACSNRFSVRRFLAWYGLGLLLLLISLLLAMAFAWSINHDYAYKRMLPEVLACGTICSIIYFCAMLPFFALLFTSGFWRERFERILVLQTKQIVHKVSLRTDEPPIETAEPPCRPRWVDLTQQNELTHEEKGPTC